MIKNRTFLYRFLLTISLVGIPIIQAMDESSSDETWYEIEEHSSDEIPQSHEIIPLSPDFEIITDVLVEIFSYLPAEDIARSREVSSYMNALISTNKNLIIKTLQRMGINKPHINMLYSALEENNIGLFWLMMQLPIEDHTKQYFSQIDFDHNLDVLIEQEPIYLERFDEFDEKRQELIQDSTYNSLLLLMLKFENERLIKLFIHNNNADLYTTSEDLSNASDKAFANLLKALKTQDLIEIQKSYEIFKTLNSKKTSKLMIKFLIATGAILWAGTNLALDVQLSVLGYSLALIKWSHKLHELF